MSFLRRLLLFLILTGGALFAIAEIVADIGGVLWLRHWLAEEGLDKDLHFRTGRADVTIRDGVVFGVTYSPEFVSEPVVTDRIYVERKSEDVFDFERSSWEFSGSDISLHLKEEGAVARVEDLFVRITDWKGETDFELGNVVATADGLGGEVRIEKVVGTFDSENSPPEFVHVELSGLRLPQKLDGREGGEFHGLPLGQIQDEMAKLGKQDAKIAIRLTARYEQEIKQFSVDELFIEGEGLARMNLALTLKDVSRDFKFNGFADLGGLIGVAKIVYGRLDIEDYGLVKHLMAKRSAEKSTGSAETAAKIAEGWPISSKDKSAAIAFLENPQAVSVELAPNKPKRIMDMIMEITFLGQPEEALRQLRFSVTNLPRL